MNKFILIAPLMLATICFSMGSQARVLGNEGGGGGDEVGIEFQGDFNIALKNLKQKSPALSQIIEALNPEEILNSAQILVTDDPLPAETQQQTQYGIAKNDRSTGTITIQRQRWTAVTNSHIKEGISLHEVLSLAGLERTGIYTYSSQYVALFGLPDDSLRTGASGKTPIKHVFEGSGTSSFGTTLEFTFNVFKKLGSSGYSGTILVGKLLTPTVTFQNLTYDSNLLQLKGEQDVPPDAGTVTIDCEGFDLDALSYDFNCEFNTARLAQPIEMHFKSEPRN